MKRAIPALLLTSLLAACGADAPPPPPAAPAPTAAAAPTGPASDCIRTLAAPQLPESWRDGIGHEADAGSKLSVTGIACVTSLFNAPLHTPGDLDPEYAPLVEFHDDIAGPTLATLAPQAMHLWRVSGSGAGGTWLLRVDTGAVDAGGRYDIVFSTNASGTLMDNLLVGASGSTWQRTYDLSPMQLNLRETTGRETQVGPGYSAMIGVIDLRFVLVDSEVTAAAADSRGALGSSLLTVPGRAGDLSALRTALFSDGSIRDEVVREQRDRDTRRILAVGATDVAGHVVYVLEAAEAQPDAGKTNYIVASFQSVEPPNAIGATVGTPVWATTMDGAIAITVPVTYTFVREGAAAPADATTAADPDAASDATTDIDTAAEAEAGPGTETAPGEGETYEVAATIALRFDPGSGVLTAVD